jgi:DNA polymerase-1
LKVVIDIETNALRNPSKIWVIVVKNIENGKYDYYRHLTDNSDELKRFKEFVPTVDTFIGHNFLGFDGPVLTELLGISIPVDKVIDTLVVSKIVDYPRQGHSVEDYGVEFGLPKGAFNDFTKLSPEMEAYCKRDVDITHRIYDKYRRYLSNPVRLPSIILEEHFQVVCNDLEKNGFAFNTAKAQQLLTKVQNELATLDKDILSSFPPSEVLIREFTPKATKFGTISKSSVPCSLHDRICEYESRSNVSAY